jgi:hypothetical protein
MVRALAVLAILGLLATLPPYLGPPLGLKLGKIAHSVEIVDHVIPGVLIFLCAGASWFLLRAGRIKENSLGLAGAVAVCMLAGVWQTSSHVPLVLDGGQPQSPWGAVIWHSTLGPIIVVLSFWLVLRALSEEPAAQRA